MKLGDVLKKERERHGLSVADTASRLELTESEYRDIEAGSSEAEIWGPRLARIAVLLETPTARLLTASGRAADCRDGGAGEGIARARANRERSPEEMAEELDLSVAEYVTIESGRSPIERYGPLLLRFAETVDQPIFNLFYPHGLPFEEIDDYP